MWNFENLEYALLDPYRQGRLTRLRQSSDAEPDSLKKDYERTSSVTEMSKSLNLDKLEDRRKVHRLSLFYFAVNNLIALPILIISYSNSISLDLFIIFHLFNQDAVMIIIFIVIFQEQ